MSDPIVNNAEVASKAEETNNTVEQPAEHVAVPTGQPASKNDGKSAQNAKLLAAKRHLAAKKAKEVEAKEEAANVEKATPFLDTPLDELRGMSAKEMQALMEKLVKETTKEQIEAQKKAHSAEIESMQKLMMDAQQQGLLEEEEVEGALDEEGNPMQSTADGGIILKNKAGDHNPILDDLRKKQKRGMLSQEESEMLEKALAYQKKMTGAAGKEDLDDEEEQDVQTAEEAQEFEQMEQRGEEMLKTANEEEKQTNDNGDGTQTFVLHLPCSMMRHMRGIMMPLVSKSGSAELPGNSLVTNVRVALLQDIDSGASFVLGTTRNIANPQDADNRPQRWADTKNPITGVELKANQCIEINCDESDVVFNNCMVGITLINGEIAQGAISVALTLMPLDDDDNDVGVVGPAASRIADKTEKKKAGENANKVQSAVERQQKAKKATAAAVAAATAPGPKRNAPPIANSAAKKAAQKAAAAKPQATTSARNEDDDDDGSDSSDGEVAGVDETNTLQPQLPPNATKLPAAPTRKQIAADPNNPKFDPLPVKERLNKFSTDEHGNSIAPDLPPGVAGYAADGTPIPIVNDGADFNARIPDVFANREYRNTLMTSQYNPEKDKPMFYNNKYQFAVVSVIGPHHCRIKTDRCVMRIWGFAKTKKECSTIAKWVRDTAYMGYIWDIGVVPCKTFFPVPPIYAEDATSTYSNPLHKQYIDDYLREQKRATIELEQRVLDDKITREKSANTMAKQLSRTQQERKATVQKMEQEKKSAKAGTSAVRTQPPLQQQQQVQQQQPVVPHRAPLAQRIKAK